MKPTKRKAFNFLRSYFDVLNELENRDDKLDFLLAIINKQFLNENPEGLNFITKLCYESQRHQVEQSVKGWEKASSKGSGGSVWADPKGIEGSDPKGIGGSLPKEEKEKEKEKEEEQEKEQEEEKGRVSPSSEGEEAEALKIKKIVDLYNQKAETCSFPKCQKLTEQRKKSVKARIKDHGLAKCEEAVEVASASDFLNGKNKNSWVLNFDWLFNPNNFVKVIEGNYNNKTQIQIQTTTDNNDGSGWSMEKFWAERKERRAKEEQEKQERLKKVNQ